MSAPLLEGHDLTMRFGGLVAVDKVSFSVASGEVLAVIGPNGAGKTTLFNLITGMYRPSGGRVHLNGTEITGHAPYRIVKYGIARTFQSSRLFGDLSVLDNVIIGMHTRTKTGVFDALLRPRAARRELAGAANHAEELLKSVSGELHDQRFRPASTLAQADRRRLEIARALATEPRVLLLDEPSSGMDDAETDALIADIGRVRADRPDLSIIVIEHDMRLVAAFPDNVICLDYGAKIAEGSFEVVRADQHVQEAYLGKALSDA